MPTQQTIPAPPRDGEDDRRRPAATPTNGHPADGDPPARPADPPADWPGLDVDLDRFRRDLGPLCDRVAAWAAERPDKVRAVYADAEYVKVTFYVVTDQSGIRFDLWDEWFDFDRGLVDDFPVGHVEMRPVTAPTFDGIIGDGTVGGRKARKIYGDA